MISLDEKIVRTQRLLQRLAEDEPYLRMRLAALGSERQQSATAFAEQMKVSAQAELERLMAARDPEYDWSLPQPAD
jgi:hypothetical protein